MPSDERKCTASPSGKHERGDDVQDSSWWCVWCSAELGPDTDPLPAPRASVEGSGSEDVVGELVRAAQDFGMSLAEGLHGDELNVARETLTNRVAKVRAALAAPAPREAGEPTRDQVMVAARLAADTYAAKKEPGIPWEHLLPTRRAFLIEFVLAGMRAAPPAAPEVSEAERIVAMLDSGVWDLGYEDGEAVVMRVHGGINDRQWSEVARGRTMREALTAALRGGAR